MEFDKSENKIDQTHGVKKLNLSDTICRTNVSNQLQGGIREFEELHLNSEIRDTI